jgi:hypothetical protein
MLDVRICCDDNRNGADVHLPHFSSKGTADMGLGSCNSFFGLPLAGIANDRASSEQSYLLIGGVISTAWFVNSQFRSSPSNEGKPACNPP